MQTLARIEYCVVMIHSGQKIRDIVNTLCRGGVLRCHAVDQVMKRLKGAGIKVACERCGKATTVTIGSFFDTKVICLECEAIEKQHPAYAAAKSVEEAEVRQGNYNFPGVGLPADWEQFAAAHRKQGPIQ